jgi:hypothetical protein
LLPAEPLGEATAPAGRTPTGPVTRTFLVVEVMGFEPLASSVRERTGVVGRPVMLADKGS